MSDVPHPLSRWNRVLQMTAAIVALAALYGFMRPSNIAVKAGTAGEEKVEQARPLQSPNSVNHIQPSTWRPGQPAASPGRSKRDGVPEVFESIHLEENPVEIQSQQLEDLRRDAAAAPENDQEYFPTQEELEEIQRQGLIAW